MNRLPIFRPFALALFAFFLPTSNAASVLLVPASPVSGQAGGVVSLDIFIDFSEFDNGALGGSFDIIYDYTALGFVSVTAVDVCNGGCVYFIPPGPTDIDETGEYFDSSGLYNWAQLGLIGGGLAANGPLLVGNVEFEILGSLPVGGTTAVEIGYFDGVADSWVAGDFVTVVEPDFNAIDVTRVPLPAAAWPFVFALASLALWRRRTAEPATLAR